MSIIIDEFEYSTDEEAQASWIACEAIDEYTKLLIHFAESNAAFIDSSPVGHTLVNSGVEYNSGGKFSSFGYGCGYWNQTNDVLYINNCTDLNQVGPWTQDFWFEPDTSSGNTTLFFLKDIPGNVYLRRDGNPLNAYTHMGGNLWTGTTTLVAGIKYHIEMCRDLSNLVKVYVNGVSEGTPFTRATNVTGKATARIGWSGYIIDGKISEFRFSEGICRHTSNFTVPSGPYGMSDGITRTTDSNIYKKGQYSFKLSFSKTTSLNKIITRRISPTINLSDHDFIKFWVRSLRTGSNFKIGFHDSGGTTTEITPNILSSNVWQEVKCDISSIINSNKDAIDLLTITVINSDEDNIVNLDYMLSYTKDELTKVFLSRGRNRFDFSPISTGKITQ